MNLDTPVTAFAPVPVGTGAKLFLAAHIRELCRYNSGHFSPRTYVCLSTLPPRTVASAPDIVGLFHATLCPARLECELGSPVRPATHNLTTPARSNPSSGRRSPGCEFFALWIRSMAEPSPPRPALTWSFRCLLAVAAQISSRTPANSRPQRSSRRRRP